MAINALVTYAAFPAVRVPMQNIVKASPSEKVTVLGAILVGTAVVAFAAAPFFRIGKQMLEGDLLFGSIARPLVVRQVRRHDTASRKEKQRFDEMAGMPEEAAVIDRLAAARKVGAQHKTITSRPAIKCAARALRHLQALRRQGESISAGALARTVAAFTEALSQNCADVFELEENVQPPVLSQSERLDALHGDFVDVILPYARHQAEALDTREFAQKERLFSETELKPTRLGNQAAALEAYCASRYGIGFSHFWPRFLLVLLKDAELSAAIASARVPFEFALVSFVLAVLSVVGWLGLLTCLEGRLEVTVGVVVVGPMLAWFWLKAVQASHDDLTEVVTATVDIARFKLIEALRLPLPETLAAERQFWNDLASFAVLAVLDGPLQTLPLKHPTK